MEITTAAFALLVFSAFISAIMLAYIMSHRTNFKQIVACILVTHIVIYISYGVFIIEVKKIKKTSIYIVISTCVVAGVIITDLMFVSRFL